MTTYTLTGYQVTTDAVTGNATAITAATMTFVTTNAYQFNYSMVAPVDGAPSQITLNDAAGELYQVRLNGNLIDLEDSALVVRVDRGATVKTGMMSFVGDVAGVTFHFAIAGNALPAGMDTTAEWDAFIDSITNQTSIIPTGTLYSPERNLSLLNFSSRTAVSEDDILIADTDFDAWVGKTIELGAGSDFAIGLSTADKIYGEDGADALNGGSGGNDSLYGGNGNDSMTGGTGNDLLSGGNNNDTLIGGSDNDRLNGGYGADSLLGGDGDDVIYGNIGNDTIDAAGGADTIDGGLGGDSILGGTGNDSIVGNSGADTVFGGTGADKILGGSYADYLDGGAGNDVLGGGTGADSFVFANGYEADAVMVFTNDVDTLLLNEDLGVDTVTEALAAATQSGRNVVFDFGDGDILTVRNITKAVLSNDIDFF